MVLTSLRFQIFRSINRSQKATFRQELLLQNKNEIVFIEVLTLDLFNDRTGLEWKDENKELTLNGQYYEVLKLVKKGNSTLVYLIPDKKESELYKRYFANHQSEGKTRTCLLHFTLGLLYIPNPVSSSIQAPVEYQRVYFQDTNFELSYFQVKIIKPPRVFTT